MRCAVWGRDGKKRGATLEHRRARMLTHCMHVQFLVYFGAVRNSWLNDPTVQALLLSHVPPGIMRDVETYRTSIADAEKKSPEEKKQEGKRKGKGKGKGKATEAPLATVEIADSPATDQLVRLMGILIHWWKKKFTITAPGLRKHGYRSFEQLAREREGPATEKYLFTTGRKDAKGEEVFSEFQLRGETIRGKEGFRELAAKCEGSRDTGAMFFTALLRALGFEEARMVFSLQPLGFGFTNAEEAAVPPSTAEKKTKVKKPPPKAKRKLGNDESESAASSMDTEASEDFVRIPRKPTTKKSPAFDKDLAYPIFWTEVYSPHSRTHLSISSLTLTVVGHTPDLLAKFSPRGAAATAAKQVHCYILSYSADRFAKDVTVRYLPSKTFPGKTKGLRVPATSVPLYAHDNSIVGFYTVDWTEKVLRCLRKPPDKLTAIERAEDEALQPVIATPKPKKPSESVSGYKTHPALTLGRHLKRDEALLPAAEPVKTLTIKGANGSSSEPVYRRDDIVVVKASENWYKEGRIITAGEIPLKTVKRRAVTAARKKEILDAERDGSSVTQGLFAEHQTELYIPPPVVDGVVPRNEFGNVDLYVPSMLPAGGVHVALKGAAKCARKLGVSYADAVTGFEFRKMRAVPFIDGVVVARENEGLIRDAWAAEEKERRRREDVKRVKMALAAWRRFLVKLRVLQRFREEYGDAADDEENPLARMEKSRETKPKPKTEQPAKVERLPSESGGGGGFIPEGEGGDENAGGFLPDAEDDAEDGDGAGGFLPEDIPSRSPSPANPPPDADDPDTGGGGGGFILDLEDDDGDADERAAPKNPSLHPTAGGSSSAPMSLRDRLAQRNKNPNPESDSDSGSDPGAASDLEPEHGFDSDSEEQKHSSYFTQRRTPVRRKRKLPPEEDDDEVDGQEQGKGKGRGKGKGKGKATTPAKRSDRQHTTREAPLPNPEVAIGGRRQRPARKAAVAATAARRRSRFFADSDDDDEEEEEYGDDDDDED